MGDSWISDVLTGFGTSLAGTSGTSSNSGDGGLGAQAGGEPGYYVTKRPGIIENILSPIIILITSSFSGLFLYGTYKALQNDEKQVTLFLFGGLSLLMIFLTIKMIKRHPFGFLLTIIAGIILIVNINSINLSSITKILSNFSNTTSEYTAIGNRYVQIPLNMRAEPGANTPIILQLKQGEQVILTNTQKRVDENLWVVIKAREVTGWVNSKYLHE